MARITGVDHVGVTVSDVDRSLGFWRDLLGLVVTGRGVVEWEHLDRLVALPGTKIEWCELALPGGGKVELSQYHRPVADAVAPGEENEPGRSHVSLLVDDLTEMLAVLRSNGVRARTDDPVDIPLGAYEGGKAAYVFDPDGVELELIERKR
ncbi:MAG TPA: VOC family protein [Actinomycetota bacterium]|jgi:catechol 2,3-dioxygenase-like lactoylglutathione lyase family enzyme|nr:VOC family protein [Actinomycetota bacterium]